MEEKALESWEQKGALDDGALAARKRWKAVVERRDTGQWDERPRICFDSGRMVYFRTIRQLLNVPAPIPVIEDAQTTGWIANAAAGLDLSVISQLLRPILCGVVRSDNVTSVCKVSIPLNVISKPYNKFSLFFDFEGPGSPETCFISDFGLQSHQTGAEPSHYQSMGLLCAVKPKCHLVPPTNPHYSHKYIYCMLCPKHPLGYC